MFHRRNLLGAVVLMIAFAFSASTVSAAGNEATKTPGPLLVRLNTPNILVHDGGLMRVTGYLNNATKKSVRYLDIYLTQAADNDPLDILAYPSPDLATVTRAIGLRRTDSSGFSLAVSLVKPGKHPFTIWVKVPDRAKSRRFSGASFFCLRMTVQQMIPGKPIVGFIKNSNGICGQYVAEK